MNNINKTVTAIELPRALEGVAYFSETTHKGGSQWEGFYDGRKLVLDKGCKNAPPREGFYAFRAHVRVERVTFVNLTRGDNGVAITEDLPADGILELGFTLDRNYPVAQATVHGTECRVVIRDDRRGIDAVRSCLGSKWQVVTAESVTTDFLGRPTLVGRVVAEILSPTAMRRRERKGKHPHSLKVIVREFRAITTSPSSGEEVSATA